MPRIAPALAPALGLSLIALVTGAAADTLLLQSGDRISGKILRYEDGRMRIETAFAGTLTIPGAALASASTDEVVTVRFTDDSIASGLLRPAEERGMTISGGPTAPREGFTFGDVAAIARGEQPPRRFRWSGRVNAGFSQTDGNSNTQTITASGSVKGRSRKHRLTADAQFNRETDDGTETVDEARLRAKHDNFVEDWLYFYTNVGLERDDIADLTLRATIGTGAGYQVFESPERNLSVEAGPSYVHEIFRAASDQDAAALRWATNFDQRLFRSLTTFFHEHEGLFKLIDGNSVVVFARTGFRVPLGGAFNITAEVDLDYDSEPAPGAESTDLKYIVTLGYEW